MIDGLRYYHLEKYLFSEVHARFHVDRKLSAFDFFSIVIWKANRAKSRVAQRLLKSAASLHVCGKDPDLDAVVGYLTESLFNANTHRDRLHILMNEWGFRLPMATAVLTVLWPDFFTVYDTRVCAQLKRHNDLVSCSKFEETWAAYEMFRKSVQAAGPPGASLRDKDRFLWGTSAARQLESAIAQRFSTPGVAPGRAATESRSLPRARRSSSRAGREAGPGGGPPGG